MSESVSVERARQAVQALYDGDRASRMLGIRIEEVQPGHVRASMEVRPDMTNGHGICHGGLIFALADSTFAFACNTEGVPTVAAAASIDFLAPVRAGDVLTAVATELWRSRRAGLFEVTVTNQEGTRVALFRGRSHRIGEAPAS